MTGQGKGPFLMISARLLVACSGVCPPERKTTPARSVGICALRVLAVAAPTSLGEEGWPKFLPAIIILVFRM